MAPGWEIAHKPRGPSDFGQRIDTARESLDQLYSVLDARPTPTYAPGEPLDPLLELRENPRLLRSVLAEIHSIRKKLARLPRVIRRREGDEPRVVTVGDAYLQATGSVWDHEAIQTFLNATQQHDAMELQELWAVPTVLKFLLLEEIIAQAARSYQRSGFTHACRGRTAQNADEELARGGLRRLAHDDRAHGRL